MSKSGAAKVDSDAELGNRVKSAVFWRSGTQIFAQLISWVVTLVVIRILDPGDYGLFAMSSVILTFLNFLNGYGFASAIVQQDPVDPRQIRQAFGMLILLNCGLAATQLLVIAPLASNYYGQPEVASMLRWQSLIYLATPFLVLPEALMTRHLEFKKPAMINLAGAIVGAAVALTLALRGFGVWTLVFAPISIFWTRAICLMLFTGFRYWPSFNFKGAGHIFSFGGMLLVSHGFWIVQSQSDIFIAGRGLDKHQLGLYAESLFLTTIFASKFVPPLNDVAFPAYSRLQNDKSGLAYSFLKAVRLIMLISCPLYFGMAVTAGPLVETVMGPKWIEATPMVSILALAMPVMTLQILFHPAINAMGKPHVTLRNSIFGAIMMPLTYSIAIRFGGGHGLALGWLVAFPLLLTFTFFNAKPHIGINFRGLAGAVWPGLLCAICMASLVWLVDRFIIIPSFHDIAPWQHLALLGALGVASYIGMLRFGARDTFDEVLNLVLKRDIKLNEQSANA
jgi:O-antigen/teichoic acid export membrane protein